MKVTYLNPTQAVNAGSTLHLSQFLVTFAAILACVFAADKISPRGVTISVMALGFGTFVHVSLFYIIYREIYRKIQNILLTASFSVDR